MEQFLKTISTMGPFQRIFTGIIIFFLVCVLASVGYMLAGWELMDSIYMVVITIFGVGYGEVKPIESPALRTMTIAVIVCGYAAVIYTVGGFVQMLIDGELNKTLGARRMNKEIANLRKHTIVCGVGRMGSILARELQESGKPFVLIDTDERKLQVAHEKGYLVINGDAADEYVLEQAGIEHASAVATVLADDAVNVFVTITARAMNPDLIIIARGQNPRTESKLLGCGADKVVLPTAIGATKVAQLIVRPKAENMLEQLTSHTGITEELGHIGLQFDELEVVEGSALVRKKLSDIEVQSNHGFLIVAVRRSDGEMILNPPTDTILSPHDVVIVLGHNDDTVQLAARFSAGENKITYRGVTIDA